MFFLKCSKCGHYNEVKTEYQTFCSNCNKKLDNNFSDWKIQHPDSSFSDFKQQICVSEIEDETQKLKKTKLVKINGVKYKIGIGVAFIVAFVIYFSIVKIGDDSIIKSFKQSTYKKIIEMAGEINKSCPVMIDSKTRLDNASVLPNNIFQCNYTLVNIVKDSINIQDAINYLTPSVTNYVKTSSDMKLLRDNKTTVNFSYNDKNGSFLFVIAVTPEKYQ